MLPSLAPYGETTVITLGIDPSLTGFGWCIHRSDVAGPGRVVTKGHHGTDAKAIFVTRYVTLRGLLMDLLASHPQIQAVGIESPPFGESYSEGLYGLFVYVCEAVYQHRKDVVFFDPQTVKRLVRMDPSIRKGSMDKSDMVEAARADTGILKGRFNHNEADAYHIARFAARFWEFVNGELTEADLVPSERNAFYKVRQFKRGLRAGQTTVTGLAFKENARFFRFSQIPLESSHGS